MRDNLLNDITGGKTPPNSYDTEVSIIGACLIAPSAIIQVADYLTSDMFYHKGNKLIYSAIIRLYKKNEGIDLITVTQELRDKGELDLAGGAYYVTQTTNKITGIVNIEYYGRIIQQLYIKRQLISICFDAINSGYSETTDAFDLLYKIEKEAFSINSQLDKKQDKLLSELVLAKIIDVLDRKEVPSGILSGWVGLDALTNGFQDGNLIICAARPAMGKTAWAINLLRNISTVMRYPVAFFSLEMTNSEIVNRVITQHTSIPSNSIRENDITHSQRVYLESVTQEFARYAIHIDETPSLSIFDFKSRALRLKMLHDIKFIVIDYLQLMKGDVTKNGTREQEISSISKSLKAIAKELNIPILALSQLSREVEKRSDKRPLLSDLRESGSIEQDADTVLFLHRPEYFGIMTDEYGNSTEGVTMLIVAKHRHAGLKDITLKFNTTTGVFSDERGGVYHHTN